MEKKIVIGMRVSTRRHGKGTVICSHGGIGWGIKFDNMEVGIYQDWEIWDEDGDYRVMSQ